MKPVLICCVHGTESYGLEVAKRLSKKIPYIIGNQKALENHVKFVDTNLNRCFPGNKNGNHEEKLALNLIDKLTPFDIVIDLHSTSKQCPLFGIITKPNIDKIELAKSLGLKKLVIMTEIVASGKALIDFAQCGISLEIGPHERIENISEVVAAINNFLENKNKNEDLELFEVFDIIKKKSDKTLIENFDQVKKGQMIAESQYADFDFTAILVNEKSYNDILCFACKKLPKLLFVCKSNFARSQIAETFFNSNSKKYFASSAGTEKGRVTDHQLKDFPEHSNLFICMDEIGFNIRNNIAKSLTLEKVNNADKIIVMAEKETWPNYLKDSSKVIFWEVKDMCGESLDEFRKARDQIKSKVEELIREIG